MLHRMAGKIRLRNSNKQSQQRLEQEKRFQLYRLEQDLRMRGEKARHDRPVKLTGKGRKWMKRAAAAALAGLLALEPGMMGLQHVGGLWKTPLISTAEAASAPTVKLIGEQPITSGATLRTYLWTSTRGGKTVSTRARVIVTDLHNPYVKLDVMTGIDGKFTRKQPVLGMAKETGAVAGINGDFFNTQAEGAPMGAEVRNEVLTSSPSDLKGMYAFGITKNNEPVIDVFGFQGSIVAADGSSFPLAGINQTYYWKESDGQHSHAHAMYIYTSDWGSASRANDSYTIPTEVLVQGDVVQEISYGQAMNRTAPKDGYILRAHGRAAQFVENHIKVGDRIEANYKLVPAHSNLDASTLKMLIGGHTILVDEGKPAAYSRDVSSIGGYRARTAIGYSQDQRRAYLITVDRTDNRGGDSAGMSLSELRDFMVQIGVWKGLLLDGGGSTQLVSRPLGSYDVELVNETEFGNQRAVVNGLGLYTLAPQGSLKGMIISGEPILFINQQAEFDLRAYDNYYNPLEIDKDAVAWDAPSELGRFEGSIFVPQRPGSGTITARSGGVVKEHSVQIIGFEHIEQMMINHSEGYMLSPGTELDVPVRIVTSSGNVLDVPAESVQWEMKGFDAKVKDGQLVVQQVAEEAEYGQLIANYDGFRAMLAFPTGVSRKWSDFEDERLPISFAGYPSYVKGSARQVYGLPGDEPNNHVLLIEYDFSEGSATKAAYAVLNGSEGIPLEGEPKQMSMRVRGDNSLNWLRVEFEDSAGKKHLVDVSRNINWTGWETVNVDLNRYNMSYPVKMNRIYVANPEQYQDEREVRGAIAVDDIYFQYEREPADTKRKQLVLTVDKKIIETDDGPIEIDQAPVVINGTTLVPLRFVADALGGEVSWDNEAKHAGMIRGAQLADLWIDQKYAVIGGKRAELRVEPQIINQRTMVPLRLISEHFGWKVIWNQEEKTITLQ